VGRACPHGALEIGSPGRPSTPVEREKEQLKKRVQELETELEAHRTALKVRGLLDPVLPDQRTKEPEGGTTAEALE
jgi:hypothetical protein